MEFGKQRGQSRTELLARIPGGSIGDILADFEMKPTPGLTSYDGLNSVVRLGSFSKSCRVRFYAAISQLGKIGLPSWPIASEVRRIML
jgi:hypothetical protein